MILARTLGVVVLLLSAAAPARAETRFLATFEDVPLAPGLTERAGEGFAFAGQDGRIAETAAAGRGEPAARARAWYAQALPALGWSLESDAGDLVFVRGRERLTLVFASGSDGAVTVRFRLVARPASLALD